MDAMDTSGEASVKTHRPLVFIIGTHRDKLGPSADKKIALTGMQDQNCSPEEIAATLVNFAVAAGESPRVEAVFRRVVVVFCALIFVGSLAGLVLGFIFGRAVSGRSIVMPLRCW